jgi:DNA-binding GntR family transcriptional regulator
MTLDAERTRSNSSIAVDMLRDLIFSGELAAGTDHLESELAEVLGMSRTPVREAVVLLEAQGLLEVRPRKGVRIKRVSPDDMAEIYDILTELESLAAEAAAKAGYTEGDLAGLKRSLDEMDRAIVVQNREAWAAADEAFHLELVRLGKNIRLQAIVTMMTDQVRRARLVTLYIRPEPTRSNLDHREVYDAILRGDAAAARALHHAHRTFAKNMILELLIRHRLTSI